MQSTIEILEEVGLDYDEVKDEVQYEIKRWFECVDFEFVIQRLVDREIISEDAIEEGKVYDEIYEIIEEGVGKILFFDK